MAQAAFARTKIPTKSPQPPAALPCSLPVRRGRTALRHVSGTSPAERTARSAARGGGEVIELSCGVTVYPAREEEGRWRAVWYKDGQRRQCEAVSEDKLAARLDKVAERLAAGAPKMARPGVELIAHYLDPGRLPAQGQWSRKHAHTQARLCERFVPVTEGMARVARVVAAGGSK